MIDLEQALANILDCIEAIDEIEEVGLDWLAGRTLAQPVLASTNQPPFDNSAMDGYAVAAPLQANSTLEVTARIAAGEVPAPLSHGCARIFTGAVMPAGANAVVMQEQVSRLSETQVRVEVDVDAGANVRNAGEDFSSGQVLIKAGTVMSAIDVALTAAAGRASASVVRRPRVAILATGDELVTPGDALAPGQIYNSNQFFLESYAKTLGAEVVVAEHSGDTLAETKQKLSELAATADIIVTSGGASVGEEDHLKTAIKELGELQLYKIKMKPGKPVLFGRLTSGREVPVLGLPGNPVSTVVTAALLLKPCVEKLAGKAVEKVAHHSVLSTFNRAAAKRREFIRARVEVNEEGVSIAKPYSSQGSGVLSSLGWATHLIDIEAGVEVSVGDELSVIALKDLNLAG